MKLHIGCGERNFFGWKHVDIQRIDGYTDFENTEDALP